MRLAIKSITTTIILAGLLVTASCVSAEQKAQSGEPAVSKTLLQGKKPSLQGKQPSIIRVTVCGKEILNELEGELEPLSKVGVVIERDADVLVLTSDRMADEVTGLLERARALMSKHPGRIEIIRGNGERFRVAAMQSAYRTQAEPLLGQAFNSGGRTYVYHGGVLGGIEPFLSRDHYAYADEDRQHAARLDRETHDLARQYVRTSDQAEREELASKLKANLDELFDLKLKGYTAKMSAIERELETLRKKVEERKDMKGIIVTGRFRELVGEDNPLRW